MSAHTARYLLGAGSEVMQQLDVRYEPRQHSYEDNRYAAYVSVVATSPVAEGVEQVVERGVPVMVQQQPVSRFLYRTWNQFVDAQRDAFISTSEQPTPTVR